MMFSFSFIFVSVFVVLIQGLALYQFVSLWVSCFSVFVYVVFCFILFSFKKTKKSAETDPSLDLDMAKRVHESFLVFEPPKHESLTLACKCLPACSIGGDFYTFINQVEPILSRCSETPGVLQYLEAEQSYMGIAIGDVAGHGVSSALVMALASGLFNRLGLNNYAPSVIMEKANQDITKHIQNSQISYVTAFYATIDFHQHQLLYCSAGHPPVFLLRGDEVISLSTDNIFLGMYPQETYTHQSIPIQSGDRLFFYTDGLLESFNDKGEPYGVERLKGKLKATVEKEVDCALETIFDDVRGFSGLGQGVDQKDDQTAVLLHIGQLS